MSLSVTTCMSVEKDLRNPSIKLSFVSLDFYEKHAVSIFRGRKSFQPRLRTKFLQIQTQNIGSWPRQSGFNHSQVFPSAFGPTIRTYLRTIWTVLIEIESLEYVRVVCANEFYAFGKTWNYFFCSSDEGIISRNTFYFWRSIFWSGKC